MLRHAKELEHCELRARDGTIGRVHDFLFDDRHWTVRYLVVETGTWLDERRVLISPSAVGRAEWDQKIITVDLTQEQVRNSPRVDAAQPVSREYELALTQYYNWPAYWGTAGFPDVGFAMPLPIVPVVPVSAARTGDLAQGDGHHEATHSAGPATAVQEDHHVRSVRTVTGHTIEATDGHIGHVDDFLIDDRSWEVRYLIVDTRNWWAGKKVVVAPQWIDEVGWDEAKVYVDLTRQAIKASPAYDPTEPMTPDYAGLLHEHYGRSKPKP